SSDVCSSDLVTAPRVCDISLIGTLAALGIHHVPVYKMPTVGIVTTGNEVVDIDQQPEPFQIRNSNQYLLRALCDQWQLPLRSCQHVSDEPKALSAALRSEEHTSELQSREKLVC